MAIDFVSMVNWIILLLAITLVSLAASTVLSYNRRFVQGEIKELGNWVFIAMVGLLAKLLADFSILVQPFLVENNELLFRQIFAIIGSFNIVFAILTALALIKVALKLKKLSQAFGLRD